MNFKIENAKTTFFTDKEHYLAFRAAWKLACNDERNKKKIVEGNYGKYKEDAWLTAAHMMLFNLLRGKDISTGFTPVTRKTKLENGHYLNQGLYDAYYRLKYSKIDLKPFAGTVTDEMLAAIKAQLPEIKPIESGFGKGRKVAQKILSGEVSKPITYQDLWNLYEEVA